MIILMEKINSYKIEELLNKYYAKQNIADKKHELSSKDLMVIELLNTN